MSTRDRHGRGLRGPLLPANLPGHRTRAQRFDGLVTAMGAGMQRVWGTELGAVEFGVEDVPPAEPAPWEGLTVPLGRCFPAEGGQSARIVIYRRPLELRALGPPDLMQLTREVLIEQVAHLLSRSPEEIEERLQ